MEECLRALAAGKVVAGFRVTYDDMHGLWGGMTLTLAGDGSFERVERPMGAPAATARSGAVGAGQVRAVAGLLLAIEAWEQRTPTGERPPVPDESWATLTVACGDHVARIVERHGELGNNRRIVRVRDLLAATCVKDEG